MSNLYFFLDPGARRRPGLYADIPVPVLQVPAGEEGGPRRLPYLLKEEEKDEEEKKEAAVPQKYCKTDTWPS